MERIVGYVVVIVCDDIHIHIIGMRPGFAQGFHRIEFIRHLGKVRIIGDTEVEVHITRNVEKVLVIVIEVTILHAADCIRHLGTKVGGNKEIRVERIVSVVIWGRLGDGVVVNQLQDSIKEEEGLASGTRVVRAECRILCNT